jgi:energy-coupling factor transport system substrate-specific component
MAPVLLIACFVCGILGGLLGRALLKKHFEKAGLA